MTTLASSKGITLDCTPQYSCCWSSTLLSDLTLISLAKFECYFKLDLMLIKSTKVVLGMLNTPLVKKILNISFKSVFLIC